MRIFSTLELTVSANTRSVSDN